MIELLLDAENALALGLLDQAERTYRTVLDADPRNGIAAVGLSRVALDRGDEAGARALARTALEIDPENATARRMLDRLDEVARFRDGAGAGPAAGSAARPAAGSAARPAAGSAARLDGDTVSADRPRGSGAAEPSAGVASQAMFRAFVAAEAAGDPLNDTVGVPGVPGASDAARPELTEAPSSVAAPGPGESAADPDASAVGPKHESSPHGRGADPEPLLRHGRGADPEPSPRHGRGADPEPLPRHERGPDPASLPRHGRGADPEPLPRHERGPDPEPPPAEPSPPTAANLAAPARPGLLRRIFRRS